MSEQPRINEAARRDLEELAQSLREGAKTDSQEWGLLQGAYAIEGFLARVFTSEAVSREEDPAELERREPSP